MKKTYQKPETEVVMMAYQQALLLPVSNTDATSTEGEYADPSREMTFEW